MATATIAKVIAAALATGIPCMSAAQTDPDTSLVVGLALHHVLEGVRRGNELLPGPLYFDARVVERRQVQHRSYPSPITVYDLGAPRTSQQTSAIMTAIGRLSDTQIAACPPAPTDPKQCHVERAAAVFSASKPTFQGDVARVIIDAAWRTGTRRGSESWKTEVTLVRLPDRWEVKGMRTLSIT